MSKQPLFAKVPIEVVRAPHLTFREFRVLVALYAFADQKGRCWPSRQRLTELTGISPEHISHITTALEKKGWLKKIGNGGRSKSSRYQLFIPQDLVVSMKPENGAPRGRVSQALNRASEGRVSQPKRCQERQLNGAAQGTGIEQTKEQTNLYTASADAADTKRGLKHTTSQAGDSFPRGESDPREVEGYLTKQGKRLQGQALRRFERFWQVFDYRRGKAEAADAWWKLEPMSPELFKAIIAGAEREASERPGKQAKGLTPKMAPGWLSGRRWEDAPPRRTPAKPKLVV
ncbi:helix-turn-helix domain-containing protein [Nitrosococcus wardiae]|uniref:Helix-turn-helix domain-containing protein n=1 Tax=Nitrosococcus wardiae TaxID=1814290 RepID=A0A4P7BY79_9GAMM|nr:helix-turn-helix domain-containing protein [Nitrosococcus wardiae]QBQ53392.1 helix-turn-helix domain-containing protein [Nitrosococcus wardiae]